LSSFDRAVLEAARREPEVELTTWGRKSGKPSRRIVWIFPDGERLFVRSGDGFTREWPKNLRANGKAILHIAGRDLPVTGKLVSPQVGRHVADVAFAKYEHPTLRPAPEGEPQTPGELTSFELFPDEARA
jgi:deazaflavin-dependent oxidoreductase (nitroreductase family)